MLPRQNPYTLPQDILTDGARAVGAFSRPYPTATVGVPTRIDFDIKSSVFKMTVEVYPGEVIAEGVATEIYLPWVHYASDKQFATVDNEFGVRADRVAALDQSTVSSRRTAVNPTITSRTSSPTTGGSSTSVGPPPSSILGLHSSNLPIHQLAPARLPAFDLAVDVEVSAGRTELSGQTLKWFYPASSAPPAASREEETVGGAMPGSFSDATGGGGGNRSKDDRTIYEIKIKRRGGPLKETVAGGGMEKASGVWDLCGLTKLLG